MPETIYKLDPRRTVHLRGFDGLGASAALHSATAAGFKASGTFRDAADFAVVVLYDADNFFEHPRLRYLPDFNFSGLTLQFDLHYTGLMPIDSPKFPTIDWPYLSALRPDGTPAQIPLFDYAQQVAGSYSSATASFTIEANNVKAFDRVTLWYMNYAFDYIAPAVECSFTFSATGIPGTIHGLTVRGISYEVTEVPNESNTALTSRILAALSSCPDVSAAQVTGNQIDVTNRRDDGLAYVVASTNGNSFTIYGVGPNSIAANLAWQINQSNFGTGNIPLSASATGSTLTLTAARPGVDGNYLAMYATSKNSRLRTTADYALFTGGSSDATWRVTLDFAALGLSQVRRMWLTLAPPLAYGAAIAGIEWEAVFTNWTVTGPTATRRLAVAGPDSVRVEEDDSWCSFSGLWSTEDGFFSKGYAARTAAADSTVTIRYHCGSVHDVWVGTSLFTGYGQFGVRLDDYTETTLNCALVTDEPVNTRRRVRSGVPPGEHVVVLRSVNSAPVVFDFLEAAVSSDVPDPMPANATMSPALDYSTDHTYKMPPARLMWSFDQLGFAAPLNEYIGVFWWNQRRRVGAVIPSVTVTFSGSYLPGDAIFVTIGSQTFGKSVFANEGLDVFARHFAAAINAGSVGVYASATGAVLTITSRSPQPAYSFTFSATAAVNGSSTGAVSWTGSLAGGIPGTWEIDPAAAVTLNRGAREWHRDLFSECATRSREVTVASSMELVNPPADFAGLFPDGAVAETAIGFGNLKSTHCAFSSGMREYHKKLFLEVATLMAEAGLTPSLQLGEFVWWFFSNQSVSQPNGGMAFYDAETMAQAQTTLGRPLHLFRTPVDDPAVNGGADAQFLRNRLRDYAAAIMTHVRSSHPGAQFELLFPYDVNHPVPAGINQLGGRLNRFVNLPIEWESKATSGLDRLKMEALDFGAWSRDLDLCATAISFPFTLDWPRASVRYLVPVFRAAAPWEREYLMAKGLGIPVINLWAYDQFCLFGLDPREPRRRTRTQFS
jgi:hypothetical protein